MAIENKDECQLYEPSNGMLTVQPFAAIDKIKLELHDSESEKLPESNKPSDLSHSPTHVPLNKTANAMKSNVKQELADIDSNSRKLTHPNFNKVHSSPPLACHSIQKNLIRIKGNTVNLRIGYVLKNRQRSCHFNHQSQRNE